MKFISTEGRSKWTWLNKQNFSAYFIDLHKNSGHYCLKYSSQPQIQKFASICPKNYACYFWSHFHRKAFHLLSIILALSILIYYFIISFPEFHLLKRSNVILLIGGTVCTFHLTTRYYTVQYVVVGCNWMISLFIWPTVLILLLV